MIYSEVIVPGRVGSGEAFEYDICYIKTVGKNHSGKTRFIDTVKLEPKKENLRVGGILGKFTVLGTIYLLTKESHVHSLHNEIDEKIRLTEREGKISCGLSILPGGQGIAVRILANSAEDVKKMIFKVVGIARKQIINASFSGIRKA
jgi:urease accessory protein